MKMVKKKRIAKPFHGEAKVKGGGEEKMEVIKGIFGKAPRRDTFGKYQK